MFDDPVATSSPIRTKLKHPERRRARNSRRSVSLLDVSSFNAVPEVADQKNESYSNETLTSVCKDSGYVRSESSFSADEDPKAPGKDLADELKSKDILINELKESNRGLRLRCADAENKIFELRLKCESHCDCCQKENQPSDNESSGDGWHWKHSHLDTTSKHFFNFKRHAFWNSLKFDESGHHLNRERLPALPSSADILLLSSKSPSGGIDDRYLKNIDKHQTPENLSLSKVERWQREVLLQKRTNRVASAHPPQIQRSKSDLDDIIHLRKSSVASDPLRDDTLLNSRYYLKHVALPRLQDNSDSSEVAQSASGSKYDRIALKSNFWSPNETSSPTTSSLIRFNEPKTPSYFRNEEVDDTGAIGESSSRKNSYKASQFGQCQQSADYLDSFHLPKHGFDGDVHDGIRFQETTVSNVSKQSQTERSLETNKGCSDRTRICQGCLQVPYIIVVPSPACCSAMQCSSSHCSKSRIVHCCRGDRCAWDHHERQDGMCCSKDNTATPATTCFRSKSSRKYSLNRDADTSAQNETTAPVECFGDSFNKSIMNKTTRGAHSSSRNVSDSHAVDPKDGLKRLIEEGMQRIASDCRAELNSLSFKPWPPPNFTNMSPLVRCLAETSQYVRQIAVGLDEATGRIQRVSAPTQQINPSF